VALKRLKEMRVFLDKNIDGLEKDNLVDILGRRNNHPAHYALYKEGLVIKDNLITFPEIKDATELRSVIRSVYWLNNEQTIENIENTEETIDNSRGTTDDEQKGQISLAFEAIKSCNQLSSSELDSRQAKRENTIEIRSKTEGTPLFHVGQVVKHKKANWRGVVVGWAIDTPKASGQLSKDRLTSLTTKRYDISDADANENEETPPPNKATVKYTILVDMHDSSLLNASKSISLESQEDLLHIDEPCLHRIHNNLINQYFSKFDPNANSYVPNKVVEYVYPLDRFADAGNDDQSSSFPPELQDACKDISNGIHEISHKLLLPVLELNKHQQADDNGTVSLASTLISMLQSMSLENQRGSSSPLDLAISSIQKLNRFHSKVTALEWSHNTHTNHNKTIEYKLGQIVKHKLFNFRGVVTAWDPKPYMDVSRWDGLQDIENPNDKPFYHIRPDVNDCITEFGSPRSWRYVCQDNLEPYDLKHGRIELEMELDSEEWGWDKENGWFAPSEELKVSCVERSNDRITEIPSDLHRFTVSQVHAC
jgi:hemimethylated DNA binding protein